MTTSHRHLEKPVLLAKNNGESWTLSGFSPWVTGAANADYIVTGAVTESNEQVLLAVDAKIPGLVFHDPYPTMALAI